MQLRCPQCRTMLNVIDAAVTESTSCPSCGSQFNLSDLTVSMRPAVQQSLGHFELIEQVGQGQFGVVWRAWDRRLNRQIAIKVPRWEELSGQDREMFQREAEAAASLEHPHIVRVYEVSNEDNRRYIVSQFIHGVTLAQALKTQSYSWKQIAELLAKVADAVHFAHERHIIHRDLKPGNILIDSKSEPFVTDFGLAKREVGEITITAAGAILGTPAYMSPEQARGDSRHTDRRSDVFSLGVILYEMLAGTRPFNGPGMTLLWQIESTAPSLPRSHKKDVPRDLETICLKAMEKAPEKRYQTAAELAADLRRFVDGLPIIARRAFVTEHILRWMRRNRLAAALILVSAVSATAAGSMALQKRSPPVPIRIAVPQPDMKHSVLIRTEPEGAKVTIHPRNKLTAEPDFSKSVRLEQATPCTVDLASGEYLVVVVLADGRFHEVIRTVPMAKGDIPDYHAHRRYETVDGRIAFPLIKILGDDPAREMVLFEGSERFEVGVINSTTVPSHERAIVDYYLDVHEVTIGDLRAALNGNLPGSLGGRKTLPTEDFPATGLFFDEAVAYAEKVGKRLPTEFEYEFAATNRGTTIYPWGMNLIREPRRVQSIHKTTMDVTIVHPGVRGLCSNAEEFTDSFYAPYPPMRRMNSAINPDMGIHVVLRDIDYHDDGTTERLAAGVRHRRGVARKSIVPTAGFRCARSRIPRS